MTTDAWVHFDITPPHTGWIRCIAPNDAILLPKRVLSVQLLLFSSRVFSSSPSFHADLIRFRPDERTKCSYHPSSSSCFLNHSMNWSNPLYYTNTIENNTINQSRRAHSSLRTACNCHVAPRACVSSCLARRCLIWFVTIRSLPARYPFLHATACQMRCVCRASTLRDCTSSPSRCLELGRRSQTRKTRKT